jgi:hypothetical protein
VNASSARLNTNNMKTAKWRLATEYVVRAQNLESSLHAVERIPSEGRGKRAQFIPIRFVFNNKLSLDDKLLLAFDALVLSERLGYAVGRGKIIHGKDRVTSVKASALSNEVQKVIGKIASLLSSHSPPDLIQRNREVFGVRMGKPSGLRSAINYLA